ncbi:MAG: glycosyltransferase 87 family protein [Aigarchaeota archaeon]|nr:glycosyltransferase 87 family protein [Candidatus Wolframiiraptor gerlachensis]
MTPARRKLLIILLIGVLARLIPAPFYAHPWDMYIWFKSGELGLQDLNIYKFGDYVEYPWGFYAYPPGWLYWLIVVALLGGGTLFRIFMIKLPIILADIASAIMIYQIMRMLKFDEDKSLVASAIWLFNPITYFISSFWGMFDSIAVLFQLLAIYMLLRRRLISAGVMAGIGASIKLIPALIVIPAMIHLIRRGECGLREAVLKLILPTSITFLAVSTPFLTTPMEYFEAIFFHAKSVGGFTYWMALSTFFNLSSFWFIPIAAFSIILVMIARRIRPDDHSLVWALTLTLTSFLAVSPKVNIQHINFLIPMILISRDLWVSRNVKRNLIMLMLSAVAWLAGAWITMNGFSPACIGRIYVPESYEIGLPYILQIVAGIFGGTRLLALMMDYFSLQKYDTAYLSKWNVLVYGVVIALGLASVMPPPLAVALPNDPIRIGVPESPDSAFTPGSDESVSQFLRHYNVTHVVLIMSPDFINTYNGFDPSQDVTKYFRFRIEADRWSQSDLLWLVRSLKSRGVKVLLGVYLKAEGPIYRYGVQGFDIKWISRHPNLLGAENLLLFNNSLNGVSYAEFFSSKLEKVVRDFGFDGVYLMAWDSWRISSDDRLQHIMPLLERLRARTWIPIFIEGPDVLSEEEVGRLLKLSDYMVLKTTPLISKLYYMTRVNMSLLIVEEDLSRILEGIPEDRRDRVLYMVCTFSFVDGWFNPAIELSLEVNRYEEAGLGAGYAIYYADRYVPYKITIKSK